MSLDVDTLYRLLPAVYRIRDAERGEPLRALVALIAQQLGAIEENLDQLYDDQFIETCADWVAPYIGDLIGYRPLHGVAPNVASPRAEVANTIRYRRRKGTALMLEQLAHDVTDWPAHAVEFFEQLATTQYMKHIRPQALATAAVRSQRAMLFAGGAFNRVAHTAEMRRPEAGSGRYNIPNIGIFLWRLGSFRLSDVPLTPDPGDATGRRFRVNPLGADLQLFRFPQPEESIEHLAEPINVPAPLAVREVALQVREATDTDLRVDTSDDYGANRSVVISRDGNDEPLRLAGPAPAPPGSPFERLVVRIADLRDVFDGGGVFTGWAHEDVIEDHQIALDPQRGRVLLGAARVADHAAKPFVSTFHYGFSRPMGGGQYEREPDVASLGALESPASAAEALQPHLDAIAAAGGRTLIGDSLTYAQTPICKVAGVTAPNAPGLKVVVGAKNGTRPLLAASGPLTLDIGARGTLVLDGLVISGGELRLAAAADTEPRTLILRDCTLVPGLTLKPDGSAGSPGVASLVIEHAFTTVRLERCIVGPLQVAASTANTVELIDCIVDAGSPEQMAYSGDLIGGAGAEATLRDCTVIGKVHARLIRLASNCIFFARLAASDLPPAAPVRVQRRQEGCMRFSFVPGGSVTPRRHRCQPDAKNPDVLPHFTSLRYGDPGYCQVRSATSKVIREGADDECEMGVMHALFQPQRETNLRIRLDEYLRFGLHAGLFYAT